MNEEYKTAIIGGLLLTLPFTSSLVLAGLGVNGYFDAAIGIAFGGINTILLKDFFIRK